MWIFCPHPKQGWSDTLHMGMKGTGVHIDQVGWEEGGITTRKSEICDETVQKLIKNISSTSYEAFNSLREGQVIKNAFLQLMSSNHKCPIPHH